MSEKLQNLVGVDFQYFKCAGHGGGVEGADFGREAFCNFSDILETRGAGVTNSF